MKYKNPYWQIRTRDNYDKLLRSGMFWEFFYELTGEWEIDKKVINKKESNDEIQIKE